MRRPWSVFLTLLLTGFVLAVWPASAALTTVAGLFQAGHYAEARAALTNADEGFRPGEEILWQSRLATDPEAALALLEPAANDSRYSDVVRVRFALESAELRAGRGEHRAVLAALAPILAAENEAIPGAVYLRAGLSLRALGQLQKAREMLASVRPNDPEFVLARYYLGDIGLEQDDPSLATRYFKAATKATDQAGRSRLAAGTWLAYRTTGQDQEAESLVRELTAGDPGSLALLEIRRLMQMEADQQDARSETATADTAPREPPNTTGRYALQLGAFSDRGLALEFVKRYRDRVPGLLRIDKSRDTRGQFLYRIRTGDYVNPALARTEARKLQQRLGIEVIATDLAAAPGGSSGQ